MLIDVTRRPVRLIFEECPSVVVIRTMAVHGKADAVLHQEGPKRASGYSVKAAAKMPQGDRECIETVLAAPIQSKQLRRALRRAWEEQAPTEDDPYYAVTAYTDQLTTKGGIWRLNFIFNAGPKKTRLLTVLDEANDVALFTVQVPAEHPGIQSLHSIATPLQRLMNKRNNGETDLWDVILEDDLDTLADLR
jgi:hypothetical protein